MQKNQNKKAADYWSNQTAVSNNSCDSLKSVKNKQENLSSSLLPVNGYISGKYDKVFNYRCMCGYYNQTTILKEGEKISCSSCGHSGRIAVIIDEHSYLNAVTYADRVLISPKNITSWMPYKKFTVDHNFKYLTCTDLWGGYDAVFKHIGLNCDVETVIINLKTLNIENWQPVISVATLHRLLYRVDFYKHPHYPDFQRVTRLDENGHPYSCRLYGDIDLYKMVMTHDTKTSDMGVSINE